MGIIKDKVGNYKFIGNIIEVDVFVVVESIFKVKFECEGDISNF